jgi:hypothetical protein
MSKKKRLAGNVARIGFKRNAYREGQKERRHWEDQGVGVLFKSTWIFERYEYYEVVCSGLIWLMLGASGGFL